MLILPRLDEPHSTAERADHLLDAIFGFGASPAAISLRQALE